MKSLSHNLYFCNAKHATTRSHVVHYLRFYPTAKFEMNGVKVQCKKCGLSQLYDLGWTDSSDNIICLHCLGKSQRGQALRKEAMKWHPLVNNNEISTEILKVPEKEYEVTRAQVKEVMSGLRQGSRRTELPPLEMLNLEEPNFKTRISKLDAFVEWEETYAEKRAAEGELTFRNVKWNGPNEFMFSIRGQPGQKQLRMGCGLLVKDESAPADAKGAWAVVRGVSKAKNVTVGITRGTLPMCDAVTMKVWFENVPYQRQRAALLSLAKAPENQFLKTFAGNLQYMYKQEREPLPLPKLSRGPLSHMDAVQRDAIEFAISHKVAAVQGPPGCGKSTSLALQAVTLALHSKHVLICTRDNAAADHVTEILLDQMKEEDLKLVITRVVGETYKPCVPERLKPVCSHVQCRNHSWKRLDEERKLIANADIVISTLCCAGGERFRKCRPHALIIDEANTAVDPEFLIPVAKCSPEFITIYGDQNQIGPFVGAKEAKAHGYGIPLIKRLALLGDGKLCNDEHLEEDETAKPRADAQKKTPPRIHPLVEYAPAMLTIQYRMHPALAAFPSKYFYDSKVTNGVTAAQRKIDIPGLRWPNPNAPLVFWNVVNSVESRTTNGKSLWNLPETAVLAELLDKLHAGHVQASRIGVITFYQGEVNLAQNLIVNMCSAPSDWTEEIEVETVDSYEGRDVDIVIIVCVRANRRGDIGFLSDTGRCLVSLTRAKYALFVIGHVPTLENSKMWASFIEHCRSTGTVVDSL